MHVLTCSLVADIWPGGILAGPSENLHSMVRSDPSPKESRGDRYGCNETVAEYYETRCGEVVREGVALAVGQVSHSVPGLGMAHLSQRESLHGKECQRGWFVHVCECECECARRNVNAWKLFHKTTKVDKTTIALVFGMIKKN